MCHLNRLFFAVSLGFALAPNLLNAQQLSQPDSMLPWRPIQRSKTQLALSGPAKSPTSDSPAWLIETAKPLAQQSPAPEGLYMVETESYANLGHLNRNSAHPSKQPAGGKRSSKAGNKRAFGLFRALGIQKTTRVNNRR